jgi:nicotinamidase-related amidase
MSMSSTDKGLLTPENCAVVFIDHQVQMFSALSSQEQREVLDNLQVLAKAANLFGAPVILTAVVSSQFTGELVPELCGQFPGRTLLQRSSMNAWDDPRIVAAVRQTGRRNFIIAALWSEACLVFPALQMLEEGFGIYVVKDASGGTNRTAHELALRRVEQAGGVSLTALQVLLEFQRDWARVEHCAEVMAIVNTCCHRDGSRREPLASMIDNVRPIHKNNPLQRSAKRKEKTA